MTINQDQAAEFEVDNIRDYWNNVQIDKSRKNTSSMELDRIIEKAKSGTKESEVKIGGQ